MHMLRSCFGPSTGNSTSRPRPNPKLHKVRTPHTHIAEPSVTAQSTIDRASFQLEKNFSTMPSLNSHVSAFHTRSIGSLSKTNTFHLETAFRPKPKTAMSSQTITSPSSVQTPQVTASPENSHTRANDTVSL